MVDTDKKEELIKQELAKRGLEYLGMKQKEKCDWEPKPHFRFKPVFKSKYKPHVGKKELSKGK